MHVDYSKFKADYCFFRIANMRTKCVIEICKIMFAYVVFIYVLEMYKIWTNDRSTQWVR